MALWSFLLDQFGDSSWLAYFLEYKTYVVCADAFITSLHTETGVHTPENIYFLLVLGATALHIE